MAAGGNGEPRHALRIGHRLMGLDPDFRFGEWGAGLALNGGDDVASRRSP